MNMFAYIVKYFTYSLHMICALRTRSRKELTRAQAFEVAMGKKWECRHVYCLRLDHAAASMYPKANIQVRIPLNTIICFPVRIAVGGLSYEDGCEDSVVTIGVSGKNPGDF